MVTVKPEMKMDWNFFGWEKKPKNIMRRLLAKKAL